ncbi:MAG: FkbM family methyltransferase [Aquisalinus sp.]|nr:FkbM family methyltransferase [Aquisalinus sp.]
MTEQAELLVARKPTSFEERVRQIGHRLPHNAFGHKIASVLLRMAGGKKYIGFDVPVFETEKARLHPFDNICEKRVYITPQFWDLQERQFLQKYIKNLSTEDIYFLDVGANAGLYSLFALAACKRTGKSPHIIAVEPDPTMRGRMQHNITASNADEKVTLLPWAITGQAEEVTLLLNLKSRGMSHIGAANGDAGQQTVTVPGHPLLDIYSEQNWPRIDILKIDIEGAEYPALEAFYRDAAPSQKPGLILIEISHEDDEKSAYTLCLENGYEVAFSNSLNAILVRKG